MPQRSAACAASSPCCCRARGGFPGCPLPQLLGSAGCPQGAAGCFGLSLCHPWLEQPCNAVPVPCGTWNRLVAGGKGVRGCSTCAPHASAALAASPPLSHPHCQRPQKEQPKAVGEFLCSQFFKKLPPDMLDFYQNWNRAVSVLQSFFICSLQLRSPPRPCGELKGASCSPGVGARARPLLA